MEMNEGETFWAAFVCETLSGDGQEIFRASAVLQLPAFFFSTFIKDIC